MIAGAALVSNDRFTSSNPSILYIYVSMREQICLREVNERCFIYDTVYMWLYAIGGGVD